MRAILRWVGATLVGALILGLVGVAGAAPASAATRSFVIVNHTSHTLTLTDVTYEGDRGCQGGDEFAPVGTQVAPGQSYRYEMVWYFLVRCASFLSFDDDSQNGLRRDLNFRLLVEGDGSPRAYVANHPHIAVDNRAAGGGFITLSDKN